jgi:hypothetical protein
MSKDTNARSGKTDSEARMVGADGRDDGSGIVMPSWLKWTSHRMLTPVMR